MNSIRRIFISEFYSSSSKLPISRTVSIFQPKASSDSASGFRRNFSYQAKQELTDRLIKAKQDSGLSFDQIAAHCGLTNGYAAQLFFNQAKLTSETAKKLKEIVPGISEDDLKQMQQFPMRSYDDRIIQDPLIYRLNEGINHYGESIKCLVNEKLGDGIMSAIDVYVTVETVKGVSGEDRVVIKLNGKFLPHIEQKAENDTSTK